SFTSQRAAQAPIQGSGLVAALDGVGSHSSTLHAYRAAYAELLSARTELEPVARLHAASQGRRPTLEEQLRDLTELAPEPEEHTRLRERLDVLRRSQHYLELAARVEHVLEQRESALTGEVRALLQALPKACADVHLSSMAESLGAALTELE